ncbi:Uncharacterised protein [Serratia plymuthica]|nr:Uncharacterised protein [Serratia plymuthica]
MPLTTVFTAPSGKYLNKVGQLDIKFYPQATHSMLEKAPRTHKVRPAEYLILKFPQHVANGEQRYA